MPNAKDLETSPRVRALLVGKSGTRKSTVGASFPGPRYMFDFDGRIGALRGVDIDYDSYPRIAGWGKAEKQLDLFLSQAKQGTLKYRTIHIASITSILDFFLWEAKEHYKELKDAKGQPSGFRVNRPVNSGSVLMSDMPHYKFVHSALDDLMYEQLIPLSLVCNILVEAHETTRFTKEGEPEGDELLATPAIAQRLPTTFDETWQFKYKRDPNPAGPGEYRIHFRNNDLAKTTFRQLPDSVVINNKENVFYDEIFLPRIKGEVK